MKISRILIACNKNDYWLTKVCVASIRYWYPEVPISLIKDELNGAFDTQRLEKIYDVTVFPTKIKNFGWGISKLEPLFASASDERYLILDSDIIFIGPVLEKLEYLDADFVVSPEYYPQEYLQLEWMKDILYDYGKLLDYDKKFVYPGFTFNSGQFVANAGKLHRSCFTDFIDYSVSGSGATPALLRKDTFKSPDQGMLNYLLNKKAQEGLLTIDKEAFMIWSGDTVALENVLLDVIKSKEGYPFLIHYAGRNKRSLGRFDRKDIFNFFLKMYYQAEAFGFIKFAVLKVLLSYKNNSFRKPIGRFKLSLLELIS